jgi:hypothetical protein
VSAQSLTGLGGEGLLLRSLGSYFFSLLFYFSLSEGNPSDYITLSKRERSTTHGTEAFKKPPIKKKKMYNVQYKKGEDPVAYSLL